MGVINIYPGKGTKVVKRPPLARSPATSFSEISSVDRASESSDPSSRNTSLIRAQDRERAVARPRVRVQTREPSPHASTVLEPRQVTKRFPFGFYITVREKEKDFLARQEAHRQQKATQPVLVRPPKAYPSRTIRRDQVPESSAGSRSARSRHVAHTAGSASRRHGHAHSHTHSHSHAHSHHSRSSHRSHNSHSHSQHHSHHDKNNTSDHANDQEPIIDPNLRLHPYQFKYTTDWRGTTYNQYSNWDPVEQGVLEEIIAHYGRITGHAYPSGKEGFASLSAAGKSVAFDDEGTRRGGRSGSGSGSGSGSSSGSGSGSGSGAGAGAASRRASSNNSNNSKKELPLSERRGLLIRSVKWKSYKSGPNYMTVYYSENEPRFDRRRFRDDQLVRVEVPYDPYTGELKHEGKNRMRRFLVAKVG